MGKRATVTKKEVLLKKNHKESNPWFLMVKRAIDHIWVYIHSRGNILSWKKLGIDPKIALPVLGTFPMQEDVCSCVVVILMVYKSLHCVSYGGYTQYDSIGKFCNTRDNACGWSVEGTMNSRYIGKDTRSRSLSKCPTRSEWFENFSLGCLKIMGQVIKINLPLSVPVILEDLIVLE